MRFATYRGLAFGSALLLCAAAVGTAQPPVPVPVSPTDKLKSDRATLADERAAAEAVSTERAKLKARLDALLDRIDKGGVAPTKPMENPKPPHPPVPGDKITGAPDQLRAATDLARNNQFADALVAFQLVPLERLSPEDRAFAKYMTAACLRRTGRTADALPILREVADSGEEPFIASSAVSQLALIQNAKELQAQLVELRSRPKSK